MALLIEGIFIALAVCAGMLLANVIWNFLTPKNKKK